MGDIMRIGRYEVISKETVDATAEIIGENSAAWKALQLSKKMKSPVFLKDGNSILVMEKEKLETVK